MNANRTLVLASASPRRRELLEQIGLTFQVRAFDLDERVLPNELPEHYVERLARAKASAGYAESLSSDTLVIGADTTVVCNGDILGKPVDADDAARMLGALSGRSHKVMSAVALAGEHGCFARLSVTEVRFRTLLAEEIHHYCLSGEPFDKAGAYAIQGRAAIFVEAISGCYSTVVGLPLQATAELLQEANMPVWHYWGGADE